ncbi:hypothetical protein V8C26DRAFT_416168, partial [Trichoderma gracile]
MGVLQKTLLSFPFSSSSSSSLFLADTTLSFKQTTFPILSFLFLFLFSFFFFSLLCFFCSSLLFIWVLSTSVSFLYDISVSRTRIIPSLYLFSSLHIVSNHAEMLVVSFIISGLSLGQFRSDANYPICHDVAVAIFGLDILGPTQASSSCSLVTAVLAMTITIYGTYKLALL